MTPDLDTARRQAALRLDEAFRSYVEGECYCEAWVFAYDHREEGYEIAEKVWRLPAHRQDAALEEALDDCDGADAADLIECAARFRLAELASEASKLGEAA